MATACPDALPSRMPPMTRRLPLFALACLAVAATAFAPAPVYKEPKRLGGRFVTMKTSLGKIKIELFEDKAPVTVKNFLSYVDAKHYDGTVFHRVMPTFTIAGGGYEKGISRTTTLQDFKAKERKTKDPIKNEWSNGLLNKRGTIAMAIRGGLDSATAQFLINVNDNPRLDKGLSDSGFPCCVFGRIIAGMDVIDKIRTVKTKSIAGFEDVPIDDVVIESVRRGK